jgi:ferritin
MDLSETLSKQFNRQYNTEIGNYGMYQSLANIAGNASWQGFEDFFKEYALDEITHAQKIADFMVSRNRTPYVDTLPNPNVGTPATPVEWMQVAYEKAQVYTALIKEIYKQCQVEKDDGAAIFLMWYITEQDRVERTFFDLITELKRAGSTAAVLLIDARYRK